MTGLRVSRRAAVLTLIGLSASLWTGCSDRSPDALTGPLAQRQLGLDRWQDIHTVIAVHKWRSAELLRIPGVVGTAVGLLPNGKLGLKVLLARHGVTGLPSVLDGIPVAAQVTGMIVAFSDPTTRQRPAPLGFSVGHPAITAGSIGARVVDGSGNVYVLSNNHVLANSNDATIGDAALQPGPYDGGTAPADQIATLSAFQAIDFSGGGNPIDAAIARVTVPGDLANTTPTDDGYGVPNSAIFGDANGDGAFENINSLLGLNVQQHDRTPKPTHGQLTHITATPTVCYEVFFGFCLKAA